MLLQDLAVDTHGSHSNLVRACGRMLLSSTLYCVQNGCGRRLIGGRGSDFGGRCNTPDVTFHNCNSNSCHFRLCDMIYPSWLVFCLRFAFCSCHAFHLMSSCASHLHSCSSHASGHFPYCPFRDPTLPHAPVAPLKSRFVSGRKTFSEWVEICRVALVHPR